LPEGPWPPRPAAVGKTPEPQRAEQSPPQSKEHSHQHTPVTGRGGAGGPGGEAGGRASYRRAGSASITCRQVTGADEGTRRASHLGECRGPNRIRDGIEYPGPGLARRAGARSGPLVRDDVGKGDGTIPLCAPPPSGRLERLGADKGATDKPDPTPSRQNASAPKGGTTPTKPKPPKTKGRHQDGPRQLNSTSAA